MKALRLAGAIILMSLGVLANDFDVHRGRLRVQEPLGHVRVHERVDYFNRAAGQTQHVHAKRHVTRFDFVACSGARTHDVRTGQLSTLRDTTTHVTISVGGNDAGFFDCASRSATSVRGAAHARS